MLYRNGPAKSYTADQCLNVHAFSALRPWLTRSLASHTAPSTEFKVHCQACCQLCHFTLHITRVISHKPQQQGGALSAHWLLLLLTLQDAVIEYCERVLEQGLAKIPDDRVRAAVLSLSLL